MEQELSLENIIKCVKRARKANQSLSSPLWRAFHIRKGYEGCKWCRRERQICVLCKEKEVKRGGPLPPPRRSERLRNKQLVLEFNKDCTCEICLACNEMCRS
jgi:hypothetical protein